MFIDPLTGLLQKRTHSRLFTLSLANVRLRAFGDERCPIVPDLLIQFSLSLSLFTPRRVCNQFVMGDETRKKLLTKMKIDFQRVSRLQLNVQFRSFVMVSLTSNVKGIAGTFYCIRQCGRCQHQRHKFESSHLKC